MGFATVSRAALWRKLESGGLDGDEALVHGALLYALSRNEPIALGRSITVVPVFLLATPFYTFYTC